MQPPCQDFDCQSKSLAMCRLGFVQTNTATCQCSAYGNQRFRFWDGKARLLNAIACAEALASYGVRRDSDQLAAAAAALARARSLQSARKAFISALSVRRRAGTPLYFFVIPAIVLFTAPWLTRP